MSYLAGSPEDKFSWVMVHMAMILKKTVFSVNFLKVTGLQIWFEANKFLRYFLNDFIVK